MSFCQFDGPSCFTHYNYEFYKTFIYKYGYTNKVLTLGDFFFLKILPEIAVCIGELELLWEDKASNQLYSSLRLYFRPEHTPDGRHDDTGEDEVIALGERLVFRLDDLVPLIQEGIRWTYGYPTYSLRTARCKDSSNGCEKGQKKMRNCEHTDSHGDVINGIMISDGHVKKLNLSIDQVQTNSLANKNDTSSGAANLAVMSYPKYCRYRAIQKRLEGCDNEWLQLAVVVAIGGFSGRAPGCRVMFCRDTFYQTEIDDLDIRMDHMLPVLKGRSKDKKRTLSRKDSHQDSDSMEEMFANVTPSVSLSSRPRRLTESSEISEEKVSTTEQAFLIGLHKFMHDTQVPIGRIPSLGFKQIDLYYFYRQAERLGGYDSITHKRMWKHLYDKLGGNSSNTSAATCTRKHYERLLLPYERHLRKVKVRKGKKSHQKQMDSQTSNTRTKVGNDSTVPSILKDVRVKSESGDTGQVPEQDNKENVRQALSQSSQNCQRESSQNYQCESSQNCQTENTQNCQPENTQNCQPEKTQSYQHEKTQNYQTENTQNYQPENTQNCQQESSQNCQHESKLNCQCGSSQNCQHESKLNSQHESSHNCQRESSHNCQQESSQNCQPENTHNFQPEKTQNCQCESSQNCQHESSQNCQPENTQNCQPENTQNCQHKSSSSEDKPVPNVTKLVPNVTKLVPNVTKLVPNVTKLVPNVTKLVPNVTKLVPNMTKPMANVTKPVTNVMKSVHNVIKSVPNVTKHSRPDLLEDSELLEIPLVQHSEHGSNDLPSVTLTNIDISNNKQHLSVSHTEQQQQQPVKSSTRLTPALPNSMLMLSENPARPYANMVYGGGYLLPILPHHILHAPWGMMASPSPPTSVSTPHARSDGKMPQPGGHFKDHSNTSLVLSLKTGEDSIQNLRNKASTKLAPLPSQLSSKLDSDTQKAAHTNTSYKTSPYLVNNHVQPQRGVSNSSQSVSSCEPHHNSSQHLPPVLHPKPPGHRSQSHLPPAPSTIYLHPSSASPSKAPQPSNHLVSTAPSAHCHPQKRVYPFDCPTAPSSGQFPSPDVVLDRIRNSTGLPRSNTVLAVPAILQQFEDPRQIFKQSPQPVTVSKTVSMSQKMEPHFHHEVTSSKSKNSKKCHQTYTMYNHVSSPELQQAPTHGHKQRRPLNKSKVVDQTKVLSNFIGAHSSHRNFSGAHFHHQNLNGTLSSHQNLNGTLSSHQNVNGTLSSHQNLNGTLSSHQTNKTEACVLSASPMPSSSKDGRLTSALFGTQFTALARASTPSDITPAPSLMANATTAVMSLNPHLHPAFLNPYLPAGSTSTVSPQLQILASALASPSQLAAYERILRHDGYGSILTAVPPEKVSKKS